MKKTEISKILPNPENPRFIIDADFQKLVKSIQGFPEMLELRPIVVDESMMILGGNMRLKACQEAGLKKVPIIIAKGLTQEQKQEFIIKDNIPFGQWDWAMLANGWDTTQLQDWGLNLIGFDTDAEGLQDGFSLNDGDKSDLEQITYTLASEQATQINNAITQVKDTEEFKYVETFANENGNGNALYLIITQWLQANGKG